MVTNRVKSGEVVTDWASYFARNPESEKSTRRAVISLVQKINKEAV